MRLFHARNGTLPASLEEVVEAKILTNVPRDPFGDSTKFDRAAKAVWSLGVNGRDDRGRNTQRTDLDFLRKLAPAGSPRPPMPEREATNGSVADDRAFPIPLPVE